MELLLEENAAVIAVAPSGVTTDEDYMDKWRV